jgi:hypothetical protein
MFAVLRGKIDLHGESSRPQRNDEGDGRVVAVQSSYRYPILGTNRGDELAGRPG